MRRIFITGGTGFFGKSILDYRLRHPDFMRDAELTILSRDPAAFIAANHRLASQPDIRFVTGDVRTFSFSDFTNSTKLCAPTNSCNSCYSWTKFDTVIHAATAAVTTLSDDEMYSTIVDGTRHVLEFAKTCDAKRILFTSSGAVYGPQSAAVDETAATNPTTAYGRGKLSAESLCIDSGIPALIARCFAFTGPFLNRRIHYAIGNFIQDCLDGKDIVIKGDGTPLRSYMYADDLVEWLFAILDRGEPGRPYNVGSPNGLSIRELAETVRTALGSRNEIKVLGSVSTNFTNSTNSNAPTNSCNSCNSWTKTAPSTYVPVVTLAETELGLHMTVPLAEAIRKSAR